jgi:hypothetical protein
MALGQLGRLMIRQRCLLRVATCRCGQVHWLWSSWADERVDVEVIPHDLVIRVYDQAGNVTEMHEQAGQFKPAER